MRATTTVLLGFVGLLAAAQLFAVFAESQAAALVSWWLFYAIGISALVAVADAVYRLGRRAVGR